MAFCSLLVQHFFGFMRGIILAGPVVSGTSMLMEIRYLRFLLYWFEDWSEPPALNKFSS